MVLLSRSLPALLLLFLFFNTLRLRQELFQIFYIFLRLVSISYYSGQIYFDFIMYFIKI